MLNAEQEFALVAVKLTTEELQEFAQRLEDGHVQGCYYVEANCGCFYGSIGLIRHDLNDESDWSDGHHFRNQLIKGTGIDLGLDLTPLEHEISTISIDDLPENGGGQPPGCTASSRLKLLGARDSLDLT